jgi:prepilin-type processing-associated H-X9-DG protein
MAAFDYSTTNGFPNTGFANHLGTWNCLFGDGHVKALKPVATITPFNMWGAFTDNTAAQGSACAMSGSACSATVKPPCSPSWTWSGNANNPNCDAPSAGALAKLQALDNVSF